MNAEQLAASHEALRERAEAALEEACIGLQALTETVAESTVQIRRAKNALDLLNRRHCE